MTVAIACPNVQDFERFAAGDAGAAEMEQFATHVEQCPECARRMDAVGDQSLLVKALRAEPLQGRDATHLAPLMAELEKLADPQATAAAHTPNPAASEISTDSGMQASFDDTEIDLSKLLAPAQEPGELGRLGAYRVLKILGAGGMGVVFQAEDTVLKRRVALKAMRPEFAASGSLRQRFLREAQAAAAVHHDHVVVIHYAGEESGVAFLTMELLEGESLEARLRRAEEGRLPLAETLRIGREIAEGLAAAHELGLIHRDIKPGNIWLQNGRGRVKILDFGLARATDGDGQLTSAGAIVGTPAYMSPEQANAEPVDFRTDLFSLGCVLYRMCTGVLPFAGGSAVKTLRAVAEHHPQSPCEINPVVPAELSALVMRLLEKDRGKRPESARAVAAEIAAIDELPVVPARPKVALRRSRWLPWAIAAAVHLAIPGGYWLSQIVIIRDRNGQEVTRIKLRDGDKVEIVDEKKADGKAADKKGSPPFVPIKDSPLAALDPAAIPPDERFDWQPKELVAVLGSHRQRTWNPGYYPSVAISGDGKRVACGHAPVIWDFDTAKTSNFLDADRYPAISPDGKRIFGSGRLYGVDHWLDARNDDLAAEPKDGSLDVFFSKNERPESRDAQFSADGKYLIARGGKPSRVGLWRVGKVAERIGEWPGFDSPAISIDGKMIAMSTIKERTVHVFAVQGEKTAPHGNLPADAKPPENIGSGNHSFLRFAHDGRLGVLSANYKSISFWEVSGSKPKKMGVSTIDGNYTTAFRFASNSPRMVTFNQGGFEIWRLTEKGAERETDASIPRMAAMNISDVAISADGNRLVSGHSNGAVLFWEVKDGRLVQRNPLTPQPASHLNRYGGNFHFSPKGNFLTTSGEAGTTVWHFGGKLPTGFLPAQLRGEASASAFFSDDAFTVNFNTGENKISAWRATPTAIKPIGERSVPSHCMSPLASPETGLVMAIYDGKQKAMARLFDFKNENPAAGQTFEIGGADHHNVHALSADGRVFASRIGPADGKTDTIRVFDIQGGKATKRYDIDTKIGNSGTTRIRLTQDGRWLAGYGVGGGCRIWRLGPAEKKLHQSPAGTIGGFSPDGKHVAHIAGTLEIRDVETWDLVWSTRIPGGMNDAVFAPDGRHLLVANANQTAYILRLDPKIFTSR